MAEPRQSIFEAVRAACFPATWSRGVELTQADTVVGESVDDEEAVFRVTTRGGMICPKVTLFPADLDWDCECSSRQPVCEHVAAAVIAWKRSVEKGGDLPEPTHGSGGRVGYRFRRTPSGLAFERVIVGNNDEEQALEATLAAVADGRVAGPRFLATQDDLAVELALETHRRGVLPQRLVPRLFKGLTACGDIRLDGKSVNVAAEQLLPRVRVEDQEEGFLVRIEPDSTVTERLGGGVALCGDVLRFLGDPRLTARERDDFTKGRHFGPSAVAELVTDVLPSLQRRLPLDILTTRLPETTAEPPRALLDMSRSDQTLSVLATLVYGDPPRARIDGTRLVHLQGTVPLRDEKAERSELRRLAELGLAPGIRSEFHGVEAVAFKSRLATWRGSIRGKAHEYFALAPPLAPDLRIGSAGFDITFESKSEAGSGRRRTGTAEPGTVLRAWREGESLVPLMGGGWAPLPSTG